MVDKAFVIDTLKSMSTLFFRETVFEPFKRHYSNIAAFVEEYLSEKSHGGYEFVGGPQMATSRKHLTIEMSNTNLLFASTAHTFKVVGPTGMATFDNIIPKTAAKVLRLKADPDHWYYLAGLLVMGSSNNLMRVRWTDINGAVRGVQSTQLIVRESEIKFVDLEPAIQLRTRGTLNLDGEFETTAPCYVYPVGVHILPQEIAVATDQSSYTEEA